MFTTEEIADLKKIKLHDIIVNSTTMAADEIQDDVFFWRNGNPCPQPMQLNASVLEPCSYLRGFDYFEVNYLTYYNKNLNFCIIFWAIIMLLFLM